MAASPTVRAVGTLNNSTLPSTGTSSVTVTIPTCQPGDLLVCWAFTIMPGSAHTASAGWVAGPAYAAGGTSGLMTFTRTAAAAGSGGTSSDSGTTMTVSTANNNVLITGVVIAYQGGYVVDASVGASPAQPSGVSWQAVAGSVSAPYSGDLVAHAWAPVGTGARTLSIPETGRVGRVGDGGKQSFYVSDEAQAAAGSTVAVSATGNSGTATSWSVLTLVIGSSTTPDQVTITSPVNNANLDRSLPIVVAAPFSSADPYDIPSGVAFRYRLVGGSTWTTSADTTTVVQHTIAANTLAAGQYELQLAPINGRGTAQAPWSPSLFITACDPPATSAVFAVAPAANSTTPDVRVRRSDSTVFAQYQVQVVADVSGSPDFTQVLASTGVVNVAAGTTLVEQLMPAYPYTSGSVVHFVAKIAQPAGVWQHAWTDSGPLTVNIQPPPSPTISALFHPYVDGDPASGTVTISWSNPTPSDPSLAAVSVDLCRTEGTGPEVRIATGLPVNSGTVDYLPAGSSSGLAVGYRVVAYTATGASASSVDGGPGGMTFGVDSYGFDTISGPGIFGVDGSGFDTVTVGAGFGTDSSGFDTLTI